MNSEHSSVVSRPVEELEACQVLEHRASGKLGHVPAATVARHVLRVSLGGDWPVQREALEAIIRRFSFARRDGLEVASRPRGRLGLGQYRTRKHGEDLRPYHTLLASVDPLQGSCDCKDFQKSGLGLCKHLLVVLDDLAGKHTKWERARAAGTVPARQLPRFVWDARCPLTGPEDWLERVSWWPGAAGTSPPPEVSAFFSANGEGAWRVQGAALGDFETRRHLVRGLHRLLADRAAQAPRIGDDPALLALLRGEMGHLDRRAEGAHLVARLDEHFRWLKRPLYTYQREGLARFLATGRLLLADDMGLGKTVQAIAACDVLWRSGHVRRGLLLVPAPLKTQWAREWALFSDAPVRVVEGGPAQRAAIYAEQREGFLIGNYEQLFRDLPKMYRWAPELMVLDEAQRIKNWATKTAVYVKQLEPEYRLVLTGTPMENRLEELASVMEWVDERAMEPKWRIGPWHLTLWDGAEQASGARNLDTLRVRLEGSLLRRIRKEVLDQLPSRTDTRVPVELTVAQRSEHEELDRPIAQLVHRAKQRPLTQAEFLRLMQLLTTQRMICNGLAQVQFDQVWPELATMEETPDTVLKSLDSPKLVELRELIRQLVIDGGQKVVVFSQWRRMLTLARWAVFDLLRREGYRAAFFSGAESQKRRTQNIIEFHDDPTLAVLFSTDAGGVGLNLQRAASSVINLELPWNPAVLEQRVGRVHRLGQKYPVQVFNLISEGGIEARIANIIGDKQALFVNLFDGTSNELRFSGSNRFMDTIEKLVPKVEAPELGESEEEEMDAVEVRTERAVPPAPPIPTPAPAMPPAGPAAVPAVPAARAGEAAAPAPSGTQPPTPRPPAPPVAELFAAIRVERTEEGGLRIEAPPETADTLAALFQGMADLLARAAR